jgi:acetolactate synthase-1/2/3 large subunit
LLIGTRTNQNGTDNWKLFPKNAHFIHIDADPLEIGRNFEALRLFGDAKLTLAALTRELCKLNLDARAAARQSVERDIERGIADWQRAVGEVRARDGRLVRPERVMAEIDRRLRPHDIVAADASYSSIWVANYLTAQRAGQRFLLPRGLAGLGWGLPLAIGAQIASPESHVFSVVGDGGFGHSWAELETMFRPQTPVKVIVLNNGILGYQKHAEDIKYGAHTNAIDFAEVDHVAIARACGIAGARVERGEEIGPALDAALASNKPTLIEVMADPDAKPPITFYAGHYPEF